MDKDVLIANYFSNNLSEDERRKFEHLLETDEMFKKDLAFQKSVKLAATAKGHEKLKQQFQDIENKTLPEKSRTAWWLAAASIIVLVTVGIYFSNSNPSTETLYVQYYEPAKNIVHPIVRNINETDNKTIAFIAYQKKDYKTAQQLFNALFDSTQESEFLFYEAISMMENNDIDSAIQKFKKHKKFKDVLSSKTNWYLALAYLKNDNIKETKLILRELISNKNTYKLKEAKELLKKIELLSK